MSGLLALHLIELRAEPAANALESLDLHHEGREDLVVVDTGRAFARALGGVAGVRQPARKLRKGARSIELILGATVQGHFSIALAQPRKAGGNHALAALDLRPSHRKGNIHQALLAGDFRFL